MSKPVTLEEALTAIRRLVEVRDAAQTYYERYCQDEADGWAGECQQKKDAQRLRDLLRDSYRED